MPVASFHPAVSAWFSRTFEQPTPAQLDAWPAIQSGRHALIAAPTGSGKTLAAFLAAIDDLVRRGVAGELADETSVVYVSPLKALSNDIRINLETPLAGIREELARLGLPDVEIRTVVRTGDTPQAERTAMRKRAPHVVVTTPESLYILLGSESGRKMLATTRSVIVDEIHALAPNKRGAHLALTLERLEALCERPLLRIGLSATQNPITEVARFLAGERARSRDAAEPAPDVVIASNGPAVGAHPVRDGDSPVAEQTAPDVVIVDTGHVRDRDLAIEVPPVPLAPVMSTEAWSGVYDRLTELVRQHRTTLIFVNTRRMAERAARHLSERLGKERVAAHHGSLAREHRLDAEQRLKRGELAVLVATASLELGIDIGDVELVCQLGSPRAIAAFLQRVGRSGHGVGQTPKGRLFPQSRDDLAECAALLDAVRRGELDRIEVPRNALDVLAQQLVAELACREWSESELFDLVRRAYPYATLPREDFVAVVRMLADGFSTRRGPRAAHVHRDAVNGMLRARRGARLTAITSGGAIPDTADYQVVLEPQATIIGSVNEDFAVESLAGDIFQLGNASYQVLKVEQSRVRVQDAHGAPPSIPFWLGEAPGRSDALSQAVSRLRDEVAAREPAQADAWLTRDVGLDASSAEQLVDYLASAKSALGTLPTQHEIVLERFFDESGGTQLVIHSPFGSRINRAWGLALRKRFCRKFNFELQAAATEDAIVLSLSTSHSFPLIEVSRYLHSNTVADVLVQALLDAPMFGVRWRWNATTALALPRFQGGRKVPPQLQRMRSEDLLATVFPDQVACAENLVGEREIPDHPLVRQTIHDCLHEAMDLDGLVAVLKRLEAGEIRVVARDVTEPSPLAAEVLNARPYAYLDDAPLEERRTQAVMTRGYAKDASELGRLDADAIAAVREEAWPEARDADELHEALVGLGWLTADDVAGGPQWPAFLETLFAARRATRLANGLVVAAERLPEIDAIHPDAARSPAIDAPVELQRTVLREDALVELVRARLTGLGPTRADALAASLGVTTPELELALARLEAEGYVMRGSFSPDLGSTVAAEAAPTGMAQANGRAENSQEIAGAASAATADSLAGPALEWCERHLLARIHRYTVKRLRREIEPVEPRDFMRFLFEWQHVAPGTQVAGPDALAKVLGQLEGFEAAAAAWESQLLPARVAGYEISWLDDLCLSGRAVWTRLQPRAVARNAGDGNRDRAGPVRTTPVVLLQRRNLALWTELGGTAASEATPSARAERVVEHLAARGASFFDEILQGTRLLRTEVEDALAELVALGRVNSDSFAGLRALLVPQDKRPSAHGRRGRRHALFGIEDAGRWALIRSSAAPDERAPDRAPPETVEHVARTLLRRYGVVCWRMLEREADWLPPWRDLVRVYHRLEARGEIRGGRFIAGLSGEQFALPEAVPLLRKARSQPGSDTLVSVSGADPLNLVGSVLAGTKVPALAASRVLYRDGVPIATLVAGEMHPLEPLDAASEWRVRQALLGRVAIAVGTES